MVPEKNPANFKKGQLKVPIDFSIDPTSFQEKGMFLYECNSSLNLFKNKL